MTGGNVMTCNRRGIIVHPEELRLDWLTVAEARLNTLGHPVGGREAHLTHRGH